jgi:hypothetical protein
MVEVSGLLIDIELLRRGMRCKAQGSVLSQLSTAMSRQIVGSAADNVASKVRSCATA